MLQVEGRQRARRSNARLMPPLPPIERALRARPAVRVGSAVRRVLQRRVQSSLDTVFAGNPLAGESYTH